MAAKRTQDDSSCFPGQKKRKVYSCFGSSSSSSTAHHWSHEVFLSFRGEDTRKTFTDHLYTALVGAGIDTFRDDEELRRGHQISSKLLKSIEESRISIVVFSRNYASSRWCLDELVKIIECEKRIGQLVLPIFYNVDPSQVRNQTGCFAEAFERHQKRFVNETEKVESWRAALTEAANLSGYDLQNGCLLRIDYQNKLTMHDLLRDMGREIVREESPKELGERSRLWFHEDVCNVLEENEENKGSKKVEGMMLTLPMSKKIQWCTKSFAGMHNLRLLQINHVHLSGNFEHLSKKLRWLRWHNCPLKYLPFNFHLEKLVVLDMQFSKIKTLWQDGKYLKSLKILNLSNSNSLTEILNFNAVPRLEKLVLESCTSLMKIHESIGLLDRLVHLNVKDCMNLKYLPGSICKLKSTEYLNLSGCTKLEELPKHLGHMERLTELLVDGTSIKQLPFSIEQLKNLRTLSLEGFNRRLPTKSWLPLISSWVSRRKNSDSIRFLPSSISSLCSLTKLVLKDCDLSEGDFRVDLGNLSSLKYLDLSRNNFRSLPYSVSHLSMLETLELDYCRSLQSISNLPPNLQILLANNCTSLEKISNLPNLNSLRLVNYNYCNILNHIECPVKELQCFQGASIIPEDRSNNIRFPFQFFPSYCDIEDNFYPGSELADYLSLKITGSSICFEVPVLLVNCVGYNFRIELGAVFTVEDECSMELTAAPYAIIVRDKTNGVEWTYTPFMCGIPRSYGDYVWRCIIYYDYFGRPFKGGEQLEVSSHA